MPKDPKVTAEPSIVYEDKRFVLVDKPAGMIVHHAKVAGPGARENGEPALTDWLVKRYPELKHVGDEPELRPGIVHRLDKETSGIMIIPRDQEYFLYLKKLFQAREIKKTYLALVSGHPKLRSGTIDAPIGIRTGSIKRSIHSGKMAKLAVTDYRVLRELPGNVALLEVQPRTGRTHQIRVHLASIGHPVVGDRLYGPKRPIGGAPRLMLHAMALEFTAEDGKRLRFEAEPPRDFQLSTGNSEPS